MKVLLLLALTLAVCCFEVQGQLCLPQASAVVPIQGRVRNAAQFIGLCNDTNGTLDPSLSKNLTKQIAENASFALSGSNCKLSDIQEMSCSTTSRQIKFKYSANLICGNACSKFNFDDRDAAENDLLAVMRAQPKKRIRMRFSGIPVVIVYFKGRKSGRSKSCALPPPPGTRNNLCGCPKDCELSVLALCSLSPEVGPCRARMPRLFYNSTSQQCERFFYGGCRGNENNFQNQEECEKACLRKQCSEGKVFEECGTGCPKTCDNKDQVLPCTLQCVQGCFCPEGMVELGDGCVPPEKCPTQPQCSEGKVFQECGTSCPENCDTKDQLLACTFQCNGGCFCPEGMVELGDGCVPPEKCPTQPQCSEGKVFKECGTACPKTCDNKDEAIPCTKQCVQGCFCPEGMVESNNGTCVPPEKCSTVPQCFDGKVFQECGTSCPKTCDNKDQVLPCTLQCVQGCFCPSGMVESGDTRGCVDPKKC